MIGSYNKTMIKEITKPNPFLDHYAQTEKLFSKTSAPWLSALRKEGVSRLSKISLPTTKDEEWKYTSVEPIIKRSFSLPKNFKLLETSSLDEYRGKGEIDLIFINGQFSKELSDLKNLPKSCSIFNLSELSSAHAEMVKTYLAQSTPATEDAFSALNRAFIQNGTVIKIDDKAKVDGLIHIINVISSKSDDLMTFPRTLVIAGKSSEAEILESYVSFSDVSYLTNAVTDIFVAPGAHLKYYIAQGESPTAFHISTTRAWQERDSQFETFSFSTGAILSRNNLTVTLNGEGASAILNGFYAVNGKQHVDNHTLVEHNPPNCTSNQLYKGILDGHATSVFNGKIFVKREAQQTNSYQLNKNLLLGAHCHANTKPQLEIFADDVRCTHGATIGQLNEDELFYLQTRSIPKDLAIKMLCRGFVDDIFEKISNKVVRNKMDNLLKKVFSLLK